MLHFVQHDRQLASADFENSLRRLIISPDQPQLDSGCQAVFYPSRVSENHAQNISATVAMIYREESRRVLATLIRLLGGFDLAEEAMQEAFVAAVERWPRDGVPANPRAWLISTGRFKAIDALRRRSRFDKSVAHLATQIETEVRDAADRDDPGMTDDRLRLIFTCCHPALAAEAQVALTLRELCGLTTEEIARAFLSSPTTIAQRIVRAKSKIRDARIPYEVPSHEALPERLGSVLQVIYLVFNEGYSASSGAELTRSDLSAEAIRLGRLVASLLPDGEVFGLLALMLFQESRRTARTTSDGELILLADQDRSNWDRPLIDEAQRTVQRALAAPPVGGYTLQAAIAAVHAAAPVAAATDWAKIVSLYDQLLQINPSPVIELNRAVAVSMRDGPQAGLDLIDAILEGKTMDDYHLAHAARADLCRQLGMSSQARQSYVRAMALAKQEPERRFLERRLSELNRS